METKKNARLFLWVSDRLYVLADRGAPFSFVLSVEIQILHSSMRSRLAAVEIRLMAGGHHSDNSSRSDFLGSPIKFPFPSLKMEIF